MAGVDSLKKQHKHRNRSKKKVYILLCVQFECNDIKSSLPEVIHSFTFD